MNGRQCAFNSGTSVFTVALLCLVISSQANAAISSWSVEPSFYDFGALSASAGARAPAVFTLTNDGEVDLPPPEVRLNHQRIDGYEHEIFEVSVFDCVVRAQLSPGESCMTEVFFRPVYSGPRSGTITFHDPSSEVASVSAGFSGIGLSPNVSFSPPPNFASAVGEGPSLPPKVLTVTNDGDADLLIAGISLIGENPGQFAIVGGKCHAGLIVAPGASCGIQLTFIPTIAGFLRAELQLSDNTADGSSGAGLVGYGGVPPLWPPARLATFISQRPRKVTPRRFVTFRFGMEAEEPVRFLCKLDRGPAQPCSSPRTYRHLALGPHVFRVRARTRAPDVSRVFSVARFEVVPRHRR